MKKNNVSLHYCTMTVWINNKIISRIPNKSSLGSIEDIRLFSIRDVLISKAKQGNDDNFMFPFVG